MARLEPELARALRRKPAPPDLEGRVLSRLERRQRPPRRLWAWSLATAATLLVGVVGFYANAKRIEIRNERARQQLVKTLSVTSREIAEAEAKAFSAIASARADERPSPDVPQARDDAAPMRSAGPRPRT